jgi:hypothetical protein
LRPLGQETVLPAGLHVVEDERRAGAGAAQDKVPRDRLNARPAHPSNAAARLEQRAVRVASVWANGLEEESGREVGNQVASAPDVRAQTLGSAVEVDLLDPAPSRAPPAERPDALAFVGAHGFHHPVEARRGSAAASQQVHGDLGTAAGAEA